MNEHIAPVLERPHDFNLALGVSRHERFEELDEAFDMIRSEWPLPWAETLYLYVHRGRPLNALQRDPRFGAFMDEVRASWRVDGA